MHLVVPCEEGVTVDHPVDAQLHHELHPPVEDGIIEAPAPVLVFRPDDHVGVGIIALVVPGILVQGGGDHLLSPVGQHLHEGAHLLEMGFAPELQPMYPCHGRGVLPQVEVIAPF